MTKPTPEFSSNAQEVYENMTTVQRARFRKLIKFLHTVPKAKFNLHTYCNRGASLREGIDEKNISAIKAVYNDCGTTACAIGYVPLLFPRVALNQEFSGFYYIPDHVLGISDSGIVWDFLFCSNMRHTDNTPEGCAKRMQHFLKLKGKLPEDCTKYIYLRENNLLGEGYEYDMHSDSLGCNILNPSHSPSID